jgi:GNAT superfamily N-acetyltransferase
MPEIFTVHTDADQYATAGQRAFQFFRRHSDDAYSSPTLMAFAAQSVNRTTPLIIIDETPVAVDRRTEVKSGGVRSCAAVLTDGRVLLATKDRHRRQGLGAQMVQHIQSSWVQNEAAPTLQFWVATRNLDALRFLLGQGLELVASTSTTQCFGVPTWGAEPSWPR